ncbi:hypothetical protein DH2020_013438 [Rehmannia glutinosa]|uniref:Folate-biopterin transporter 3 n=1 Tax=Rehmannia glutinosa TaxID=99300 RepID=A0ABR0X5L9_REHGL
MDQDEKFPLQEKQAQKEKPSKNGILGLIFSPFDFLKKLSDELHWSFVLGVVIVYGINQGIGLGLSKVSTQYYMKDEQKLQPSEAQVYHGLIMIPWIVKPLWGLLTDTVPIAGYRRRPYFIFAGIIGAISMITLSLEKNLYLGFALLLLICGSGGAAVADVTIDACVTENSITHPSLAGEMQSLCGLCSSVGQLIGYTLSGFLVHLIGSKVCDYHYSINLIKRTRMSFYLIELRIAHERFGSFTALSEVVGSISAVGAVGSLLGVLLYQNAFRSHPFRRVLFWAQLLYGASGMLDLILVLRINLIFGVPDYIVVVFDAAVSHMIGRLKWMPLLVLSSKLCPAGIEGTFFALIMSIDHIGSFSASWGGGFLLHALNVTRTTFDNLWLAILIRSIFRVLPIGILFLIPSSDPNVAILPTEMLRSKKGEEISDPIDTEMESLVSRIDLNSPH